MELLDKNALNALESSARSAAAYLDACDSQGRHPVLNPSCYRACSLLLIRIFSVADPAAHFPLLLQSSPAAREILDSLRFEAELAQGRSRHPELFRVLERIAG